MVTGPAGEEIHCDQYGRVKVRFPWDRYSQNDEHSSAWLRVSQGWAGGQYGFMALPRIGHEVIVSFLDGDPDQPIITGRTHHATNQPPYALPEHKTRTTLKTQTHKGEGSNELRFEDEAGQEQVYVHAQRNLDLLTEHNRTEVVRNDSHRTIGNHLFSRVRGSAHATVEGEARESYGADVHLDIAGSLHASAAGAFGSETGQEVHHKAGTKVVVDAGAELTIAGGGSFIRLDASGVTLSGPGIKINSGGAPGTGAAAQVSQPELPMAIDADVADPAAPTTLAEVDQRQDAKAQALAFGGIERPKRELIVDVIGGGSAGEDVVVLKPPVQEAEQ